jgi:signal transduction histidine kinase
MFWSFAIGGLAMLDFLPNYSVPIYPFGFIFMTMAIAGVTYTFLRFPVLQQPAVPSAERSALGPALSLVFLYALVLFILRFVTGGMQYLVAGIIVGITVVFAERLMSLHKHAERIVQKRLDRDRYEAYSTVATFIKGMLNILDLRQLVERILDTVTTAIGAKEAALFLFDQEKQEYQLIAAHGSDHLRLRQLHIQEDSPFVLRLTEIPDTLILADLEQLNKHDDDSIRIIETLRTMNAELCIPLRRQDRLLGFLTVGRKPDARLYADEEINLLSALGRNAGIAIDNALVYGELRNSQLLNQRTDRLRSLETMATEFANEIRNPLTSIKTFIQLATDRTRDSWFTDGFIRTVLLDVDRISRLIQDVLDYARFTTPKLRLETLNPVVSSCLYLVRIRAKSRGIEIEHVLKNVPPIHMDRQQIRQVVLNLLLQALDVMNGTAGKLFVSLEEVENHGKTWVQLQVKDTGAGIPATEIEHVFDPFYTTNHRSTWASKGLGLAMVHQIVREHGGFIEVISAVGHGTAFLVYLPLMGPEEPSISRLLVDGHSALASNET